MPAFFPRHTVEIRLEEPKAFRKFSYSLVEMAIVTGVLLRVYRLFTLTHGSDNWLYIGSVFAIGFAILLGMLTAHLANYPLHQYSWRAPLFVLVEVIAEMATSALLISFGREAEGTARAHFHDWPSMAARALLQSELTICLWALLLAAVIIVVRRSGLAEGVDAEPVTDPEIPA